MMSVRTATMTGALVGVMALALVVMSGCASSSLPSRSGGDVSVSQPTPVPSVPSTQSSSPDAASCGPMPVPSGPLTRAAVVVLRAPATGRAGADLTVSATVVARFAHPRVLTVPASSAVLVVRNDVVLARTDNSGAGLIPLMLTAGAHNRAQAVPQSVRLNGCHGPLPAGRYELIAVLGYRVDSLNAAADGGPTHPANSRTFLLLSAALPVLVG